VNDDHKKQQRRDLLKRYCVALVLAPLALFVRGELPFEEGTSIYQLPLAAVVLTAWYGGRGPGLLASLICMVGASYLFVPPVNSFSTSPQHVLPLSVFVALCLLLTEFSAGRRSVEHRLRLREEERRQHVRFFESIDRIHRAMQGTDDVEHMLDRALGEVLDIFQCDRAVFGRHAGETETKSFTLLAKRERPGFTLNISPGVEVAADEDLSAMSAELKAAGGPVQWVLGSVPPGTARVLERFGVQSVLSMPIEPRSRRGDHFFVFTLRQCTYRRVWNPEEVRLFREIGLRLGDATVTLSTLRGLRESERRLEAAQEIAHVGWWERNYETGRVALSDEACRIFGVPPVELPQWHGHWLSLIHPDDRPKAAQANEIALGGGPRYDVEYRVVRPDGTERMVHSQGDVVFDPSGRPILQFGVMQDITDLRETERELRASEVALRESEQRYRTLFDKANDAIFLENKSDEIIEVNERACTLLGYSRDELVEMKVSDVQAPEVRGDAGRVIREEIAKHGSATFESIDIHRSGRRIPVEVTNTQISDRGERLILSVVRDVTERKRAEDSLRESEARFRTFVDRATDAFYLLNEELRVIDVNRQACESLGWTREELIGMHPREFDVGMDAASILELAKRAEAGEIITFETFHKRKDGTVLPVEIRTGTFRHEGKLFYLALARDVTERKIAEETLRAKENALETARAELARVSRLTTLGELTTSIVHEVSQPLGAMVASAAAASRWLAATPPDVGEACSALDNIAADGKRARDVIARIRAQTKRQAPRMELLDVNHKIREAIALTDREVRNRDILLRMQLDANLPPVSGDGVQLQQVLINLVVNAAEAMSDVHDRPRELKIVSRPDGADTVLVEVRDSGVGLNADDAERVFEAFYTTKAEGMGMGLSISRSIIEAHGGRLWATPAEPHGAIFSFSLPAAEQAAS
jgi:PAS domain S-box-containing protein